MTMDDALKRIKELEEELMKVKRKNKVKRSRGFIILSLKNKI